VSHRQKAIS